MKTLALVGAGNIGSRHLQSLANLGQEWNIVVVEPDPKSMATAQLRYEEVVEKGSPTPDYCNSLEGLPATLDICILATLASRRLDLVQKILAHSKCRYMILEKVAFQSPADFVAAEELFAEHGVDVWVNCPRRLWPVFKELKKSLAGSERIECHFSRSHFAMTCNAVHLIDVFQFLTGFAGFVVHLPSLQLFFKPRAPWGPNKISCAPHQKILCAPLPTHIVCATPKQYRVRRSRKILCAPLPKSIECATC